MITGSSSAGPINFDESTVFQIQRQVLLMIVIAIFSLRIFFFVFQCL